MGSYADSLLLSLQAHKTFMEEILDPQGTINKKEAFIWWALPLHRQRLEDEQK